MTTRLRCTTRWVTKRLNTHPTSTRSQFPIKYMTPILTESRTPRVLLELRRSTGTHRRAARWTMSTAVGVPQ